MQTLVSEQAGFQARNAHWKQACARGHTLILFVAVLLKLLGPFTKERIKLLFEPTCDREVIIILREISARGSRYHGRTHLESYCCAVLANAIKKLRHDT